MLYHYRCRNSKCRARRTFKYKVHLAQKEIKCECGRAEWVQDRYRDEVENKKPCKCGGYHFPHRNGSLWCDHSTSEITEDDYRARYG